MEDHCSAIATVLSRGRLGETYNIGGEAEKKNIEIVMAICEKLDIIKPRADGQSYRTQISHVQDRLGHDRRYAMDIRKIQAELNWAPKESFDTGLDKTIVWYLHNLEWVNRVMSENYDEWIRINYLNRTELEAPWKE